MKKFIVSDLHGNGNIYNSIMSYLSNVNKDEEVILYINGDLIDRGLSSADMLLDVKNRIENNIDFKIVYLGGNHELLMYEATEDMESGTFYRRSNWLVGNGGLITLEGLDERLNKGEICNVVEFVSNLKIYNKFSEKIDGKQIVLAHAKCPSVVHDECNLRVKDNKMEVYTTLWARKSEMKYIKTLGNKDYFTIIGHTPVIDEKGFEYYEDDNVLNIDGGCAYYACGYANYNHTPLIQIDEENNRLIILTFNNNNEIVYGNYFQNKQSVSMPTEELENHRRYIDKNVKIKELKPW